MSIRVKLRDDAYYAEVPDGVHILTNQGETSLAGASVHDWLERLAPLLDGRYSVEDITGSLSPRRREFVTSLITTLVERGVVRQVGEDLPHGLTEDEVDAFAPEIGFIAYFRDSAGRAFERYRNLRVAVLGTDVAVAAVRRACLRSGVREVDTATAVDAADLVIHVSDDPRASDARGVAVDCAEAGVPLAQAMLADGHAWLQPTCRVGVDGHGCLAGWRRLLALCGEEPGGEQVGEPAVTLLATQLVHDAFRYLTELRALDRRPRLIRVCLDTLVTEQHEFVVHPLEVTATTEDDQQFLDRFAWLSSTEPLAEQEFSQRAVALTDSRLGIFGEINEGDLAQLPVHVTQTTVSDPVGLLGTGTPRPAVSGSGLDFETARYQAALNAVACYGSLMVDSRLLLDEGSIVRAVGLADGAIRPVAATQVFPALREPGAGYRVPDGVAAAFSWDAVVEAGLVAHCRRLTIVDALRSPVPFPRLALDSVPADSVLDYCVAMLDAIGEPVDVHDVTGSLGVPTFECSLSGRTVAYGSALLATEALRRCLLQALLAWQARVNDQSVYAPSAVLDLPRSCRGPDRPPAHESLGVPAVVERLAGRGLTPAVVPLDHDREVHRVIPFIAHVVLI